MKANGIVRQQREPWTADEKALLRRLWPTCTYLELSELLGRRMQAIYTQARKLGLEPKKFGNTQRRPTAEIADRPCLEFAERYRRLRQALGLPMSQDSIEEFKCLSGEDAHG